MTPNTTRRAALALAITDTGRTDRFCTRPGGDPFPRAPHIPLRMTQRMAHTTQVERDRDAAWKNQPSCPECHQKKAVNGSCGCP